MGGALEKLEQRAQSAMTRMLEDMGRAPVAMGGKDDPLGWHDANRHRHIGGVTAAAANAVRSTRLQVLRQD